MDPEPSLHCISYVLRVDFEVTQLGASVDECTRQLGRAGFVPVVKL